MRKHIPATAPVRLAALTALGFLVVGCGGGTDQVAPADDSPAPSDSASPGSPGPDGGASPPSAAPGGGDAETELVIEVALDPDADTAQSPDDIETGTWTLTCSPVGGDHPDPEAACADLEEAGAEAFEPVPRDQPCTHIYGGPETATVTGHVGGTEIDAGLSKAGGCELNRWENLGAVLSP
ncbi:hypothetical protein GCM10022205_14940 [Spinactinospora alkalitolerans]